MYYDDIISLFVANYAESYPVDIPGLGACAVSGGSVGESSQPTDAPWLRITVIEGSPINVSVGSASTVIKDEPFALAVQIFIPKTEYSAAVKYTPNLFQTIQRNLDAFLIIDPTPANGETATIYSDPAQPIFKTGQSIEESWVSTTLQYQYIYRYI